MIKKSTIKEISLYTVGDSNKLSTWSNVPYLFAKSLEKRGIIVNRINICSNNKVEKLYNKYILPILSYFYNAHNFSYERSFINRWLTKRKIKKSQYPNSQYSIFMSLSFYNQWNKLQPSILFGDWTYDFIIKNRLKRNPYWFEQSYINFQTNSINHADIIISLFPKCCEYIKKSTNNSNIYHLKTNVVNNCYHTEPTAELIAKKSKIAHIIFIGSSRYISCAIELIKAVKLLNSNKKKYYLDIIGLKKEVFTESLPQEIICYGYLNKSNDAEREIYYQLLMQASILVNTTPNWAGYSSTIEAMYYYTPIIISKYTEFVTEFGNNISFGKYSNNTSENIAKNIQEILHNPDIYNKLALNAHETVSTYTWDNYIDKFLTLISNCSI